ncbi:MAG TPA: hypothetical protein P5065_00655 [Candidatus Ratteibacteria bacterium]|nr:hypothetical protein [Candidatus Ratteibacteria bacterium]HRV03618.1 hypothetical protein [Candidatus Ratteibacteria bacterium]
MKISELLKGENRESQKQLDKLFCSIGDNPRILWYPSAGDDYRDISELSNANIDRNNIKGRINIATDYEITELPDIFVHTDYFKRWAKLRQGEIFNDDNTGKDDKTRVTIENLYELQFNNGLNINYNVNEDFVVFPEEAPKSPEIYLLDVRINSDTLGEIRKPVFYFLFENINFLEEVLLRNRINISHIVKVREGCAMGGNKKSITVAYAFLSVLNTKYLIIDNHVEDFDFDLFMELKRELKRIGIPVMDYKLEELEPRPRIHWSGKEVRIFKVIGRGERLTRDRMEEILKPLE